jgi:hypothetical protein
VHRAASSMARAGPQAARQTTRSLKDG